MPAAAHAATKLAFDDVGAGTPVVFLHGLTFDRRTWRPIVDRLGGRVRSIAVDLPGHGESVRTPGPLEAVAPQVQELLASLGVEAPVVVGHSMAAGIAAFYAADYPTSGVVFVDSGPEIKPFAELVRRLEPALRSPQFPEVWKAFEESLGLDLIPEPTRSLVYETHKVEQNVVLGYWDFLLRSDPTDLQTYVDSQVRSVDVPCLGIFGRAVTPGERKRFSWVPDTELEEWVGDGHFVHLVDPNRFAARLLGFVRRCTVSG